MGASVLTGSKDAAGGGGGGGGGGNVDTPAEEKGQSVPLPSALHTRTAQSWAEWTLVGLRVSSLGGSEIPSAASRFQHTEREGKEHQGE